MDENLSCARRLMRRGAGGRRRLSQPGGRPSPGNRRRRADGHSPCGHRSRMDPLAARNSAGFEAPAGMTCDPVVLAPLHGRLHVLLVRRDQPPDPGRWALPGGFMSPDERPEQTAQRKLTEETGVGAIYLEQLQSYAEAGRDPRGWIPSIAYLALIDAAVLNPDATGARWWPVDDLPPLAMDHARIVADGVDRLRGKLWYSNS